MTANSTWQMIQKVRDLKFEKCLTNGIFYADFGQQINFNSAKKKKFQRLHAQKYACLSGICKVRRRLSMNRKSFTFQKESFLLKRNDFLISRNFLSNLKEFFFWQEKLFLFIDNRLLTLHIPDYQQAFFWAYVNLKDSSSFFIKSLNS